MLAVIFTRRLVFKRLGMVILQTGNVLLPNFNLIRICVNTFISEPKVIFRLLYVAVGCFADDPDLTEFTTQQHPYRQLLHSNIKSNKEWNCPHGTGLRGRRDNVGAYNNGLKPITQGFIHIHEHKDPSCIA